jgi:uncharacterized protein (TIGR03437 family)
MKCPILLLLAGLAAAQTPGPTAKPSSVNFTYQVNSPTFPAAAKVTASLPAAISSLPMNVTTTSTPPGWLTVTPDTGHSPLALTVTVNPTTLTPGSYPGTIRIDTVPASGNPVSVTVTLSISNPPSRLNVLPDPPTGASTRVITFTFTTGDAVPSPASAELDVASNGDIIPFNVTASGSTGTGKGGSVWLRVAGSGGQLPNLTTSGVALSGSSVPIYVTVDPAILDTLDPGSYAGQITIAASNPANGSVPVLVNLVVSAGAPTLDPTLPLFPPTIIAGPALDPVITIYGKNFFTTSVVTIQNGANPPITVPSVLLSHKAIQATIKAAYLAATAGPYPMAWTVAVTNPPPPRDPSQGPAFAMLWIMDPSQPAIMSVVNSASFLPAAVETGSAGADPVPLHMTAVAPREIISIFGQNLGPSTVTPTTPTGTPPQYPLNAGPIRVDFTWGSPATTVSAPLIVTSGNQINCVVPFELAAAIPLAAPNATVTVWNGASSTAAFPLVVIAEDPGVFTFGGLGQGQGAVLNFDSSTGSYVINAAKAAAPRGSAIAIYATGLGDFASPPVVGDGEVAITAVKVADYTPRVDIDGQPAVVTYAGMAPGAVVGLVQVNAIVPPTVRTGAAIPMTVSIGNATVSRRSQPGVTIAVK